MRELYKRFVKTWIRYVSWSRILTPKRFDLCLTKQIRICFVSWITIPLSFQKICRLIFKRFDLFSQIQRILTNRDESLVHRCAMNKSESIQILCFGLANPYPVCGFVLSYCIQKICFVIFFSKITWFVSIQKYESRKLTIFEFISEKTSLKSTKLLRESTFLLQTAQMAALLYQVFLPWNLWAFCGRRWR